jgi:hypothetical protein
MDRVGFIQHKGKRVLFLDYRDANEAQALALIKERRRVVAEQPKNSLLTVADLTGADFTKKVVEEIKAATVLDRPYVKRAALVGVETAPKGLIDAVSTFSHREWAQFKTMEEALDWVVAEEEDNATQASA